MTKTKKFDKEAEKMAKDLVNDINLENIRVNDLYKEWMGMSNIEKVKEEGFVTRKLMNGWSKNKVLEALRDKHPGTNFNYADLEKFIVRHDEIVQFLEDETFASARRHISAQADIEEHLASLLFFAEKFLQETYNQGDASNVNSALNNVKKILESYANISGMRDKDESPDTIVSIYSDKYNELKKKANKVNFTADIEEEDEIQAAVDEEDED